MKKKTKIKIAFILNIIIVLMTLTSFIMMFTGFKFMHGPETTIASSTVGRFRFFTIDSNLLMGVAALLFAIQQYKVLKGKKRKIDIRFYVYKLMATCSVGLTFIIVFFYLSRITPNGFFSIYMNQNLFFHGLIPLVSMINFILYEKTNQLEIKHTFMAVIPVTLYAIYYVTNILLHMKNNYVSPEYDWYYFVQNGVLKMGIVVPMIFLITYFIGFSLLKLNRRGALSTEFIYNET